MLEKLTVKKNVMFFNGLTNFKLKYNSKEELCDILFNFINSNNYEFVYLFKYVNFKNNNNHKILKEGIYHNQYGLYKLSIVIDKEYLSLIKGLLYQFDYKRYKEDKELILK